MEYSIKAVSRKMILVLAVLSALVAVGGGVFYFFTSNVAGILPFAIGVLVALCANVIKTLMLKNAVEKIAEMEDAKSASVHLQGQQLLRLVITGVFLALAHFAPDNIVNLMGAVVGILTLPVANHIMYFFVRDKEGKEKKETI